MDEHAKQLLISEHQSLRNEILFQIKELVNLQKSALYVSGALWAWFATNKPDDIFLFVVWLPLLISITNLWKLSSTRNLIDDTADYLYRIERRLELPKDMGWQTHHRKHKYSWFNYWSQIYWGLLILGNIILAVYISIQP